VTIAVLLADDHAMLRAGLRALLNAEPYMHVVGEAANGEEAVRMAEQQKPDVVVMDISMPVMDGLAATREIAARLLQTRVLVLTTPVYPTADMVLTHLHSDGVPFLRLA